ncbi:MAG: DUF1566 domain-containing protein [Gammaproteobacteria bacterium]
MNSKLKYSRKRLVSLATQQVLRSCYFLSFCVLVSCGGGDSSTTNKVNSVNNNSNSNNESININVPVEPAVQFAVASQLLSEGTGQVTVSVSLSAATTTPVTVPYTVSGSALQGTDYTGLASGSIIIPDGTTQSNLTFTLVDDVNTEGSESIILTMGLPDYANRGTNVIHTINISDNDPLLNDTGIQLCGDAGSNNLSCPQASFVNQDADKGRDTTVTIKVGVGRSGFDFTKLDSAGSALADQTKPYATQAWSCVYDNVTQLTWEIKKVNVNNLQHNSHTYSWYNTDNMSNGGVAGTPNGGFCINSSDCDTEAYISAINALNSGQGLCGKTGWRLPTVAEMQSIVDYSSNSLAIDNEIFPNTKSASYWTSLSYADPYDAVFSIGGNLNSAWHINFTNGDVAYSLKSLNLNVRLVTGN